MRLRYAYVLAAMLASPMAIAADNWSATLNWTSAYIARGFIMTSNSYNETTGDYDKVDAALQGGIDYFNNGWFVGTWMSTVSDQYITDGKVEWDGWAGYANETDSGLRYTANVNYYTYPSANYGDSDNTRFDYGEVIVGLGMGWVDASYAVTYTKDYFGYNDSTYGWLYEDDKSRHTRGSGYFSVDSSIPLSDSFALALHAGYQHVHNMSRLSYSDALVALETSVEGLDISLAYARAWNSHGAYTNDIQGQAVLTVGHTF